jgi:hypothetical protein
VEKGFWKRVWEFGKILDWEEGIWVKPNPSWGEITGIGSRVLYGGAHRISEGQYVLQFGSSLVNSIEPSYLCVRLLSSMGEYLRIIISTPC